MNLLWLLEIMINTFKKTILAHGPSGCGKDTQIDLLRESYDFEKIGTGEMFRELLKDETGKYKEVQDTINKGEFVSSDLTYELLCDWVENYDPEKTWFFVSVVRSFDQVSLLDNLLDEYSRDLDLFLHFKLSEEEAIERMSLRKHCMSCGRIYHDKHYKERKEGICDYDKGELIRRDDDKPEAIKKRLEEYKRTIEPILQEYDSRGILIEVDASPSIREINQELLVVLSEYL